MAAACTSAVEVTNVEVDGRPVDSESAHCKAADHQIRRSGVLHAAQQSELQAVHVQQERVVVSTLDYLTTVDARAAGLCFFTMRATFVSSRA